MIQHLSWFPSSFSLSSRGIRPKFYPILFDFEHIVLFRSTLLCNENLIARNRKQRVLDICTYEKLFHFSDLMKPVDIVDMVPAMMNR